MATGKVKTLYSNKEKTEALFPRTKTSAISDANGVGLDAILDDMATETFVQTKIAEAQMSGGNVDLSGYATKDELNALSADDVGAQPKDSILLGGYADLNTITDEGEYYYGYYQQTITNSPVHSAFHLSVKKVSSEEVSQTYTQFTGNNNIIYTRQSSNNKTSWSAWNKVYDTANKPSASDVGAVAKTALKSLAYSQTDANGDTTLSTLSAYPTAPGVFRVGAVISGLPSDAIGYGTLVIFDAGGYFMHLYRDGNGHFYIGRTADGVKIPTASNWKHCFDAGDTISIANGGTGATDAANALTNLGAFRDLGTNVINSKTNDTIAKWSGINSGYSYYSVSGYLNDQPSQYGLLLHFHYSSEVFQFWRCLPGGPTYWRSGNASGWHGSWTKVYDTANKPTPADIGAAASSHNHSASNITSGTLPIARGGTGASDIWNALTNLGLRQFRTYYFDNCSSPLLTLQSNYNSIDNVACLIYCMCGGTRYALVGYKVDNYCAFVEVGYGTADLYKYRNNNGTWTMHTYKAG